MIYILAADQRLYTKDVVLTDDSFVTPFKPSELANLLASERALWRPLDDQNPDDRMWLVVRGYIPTPSMHMLAHVAE